MHIFLKQSRFHIEIKKHLTDEGLEEIAARGHDPKSLPTLIRALDAAKEYELPLLLGSIKAIINAAPEAYDVLKGKEKTILRRHFLPAENA